MRSLLTFLLIPVLLLGTYSRATEYTFEITWAIEEVTDVELAGFRLYDLEHNQICQTTNPADTTLTCTTDITGTEGTFTLVSYSTAGIESDPSDPFTINFKTSQALPAELAAVINATTTEGSLQVNFNGTASTGTITRYTWNFNDGSASVYTAATNHTFAAAGTYTVYLTVQGADGSTGTMSQNVTVSQSSDGNQPPTASLVVTSAVLGDAPLTVNFDASASSDPEGSILTWFWDFGDGTVTAGSKLATHQYLVAGTYTAKVTVTDPQAANSSMQSQPIMVTVGDNTSDGAAPSATIAVTSISGTVPIVVSFSGENSAPSELNGSITDYHWNFGDGSTGAGSTEQHTYIDPGSYTVQLTVTDSSGKQAVTTKTIQASVITRNEVTSILIQVYKLMLLGE